MLFGTMAKPSPFARSSASLSKWASSSNVDEDLHVEPGRPKFARAADEKANDWGSERASMFKVGQSVKAIDSRGVVKAGSIGKVTKVEKTNAGAFVYHVDFGKEGTARMLQASLKAASRP